MEPPQAPPRGSNRGCIIALAIVGGLTVLGAIAVAIGLYVLATSKEGKAVISMVSDGAKVVRDAQTAPGTNELRASGCEESLALDMAELQRVMRHLDRDGGMGPPPFHTMVVCTVNDPSTAPGCDAMARVYVRALPGGRAPGEFLLQVSPTGNTQATMCANRYAPNGDLVAKHHGATPAIPGAPPGKGAPKP